MHIKKSEAKEKSNAGTCKVWEYDYPSENMSFATALINGRYPKEKKITNLECEQTCFVISGNGKIYTDKGEFELNEGDVYWIKSKEKYYFEGDNLLLALINSPKWRLDQHREVD